MAISVLLGVHIGAAVRVITPQYKAVQKSMEDIIRAIRATPSAKDTLCIKFKQENWIDMTDDCSEAQLVECVLEKIRQDPSKFATFVSMLRDTPGITDVADKLEHNMCNS